MNDTSVAERSTPRWVNFGWILDTCIQCLVYQHRMRIDYRGLRGEGKIHGFDPYTLTTYRGGLYLIAYIHLFKKIIWIAIERIRNVEKLPTTFEYPKTYSPQKHTEGIFGIIDGPETRVELLLRNADTAAYLSSRRLHPTQQFSQRRDGTTLLTMTVRGTTELLPWILSLGPVRRGAQAARPARPGPGIAGRRHGALCGRD